MVVAPAKYARIGYNWPSSMTVQIPMNQALPPVLRSDLSDLVQQTLAEATRQGADAAETRASCASGLSVNVRLGAVDTLEQHQDKALHVSVYIRHCQGSASSSDFSPGAIRDTVRAACTIARHTSADEFAGLVDAGDLTSKIPELGLDHPWLLDSGQAIALASACEAAALARDPRIHNSDGAGVSSLRSQSAYGNSHGFIGGWCGTRHGIDCTVLAEDASGKQRDFSYDLRRAAQELRKPAALGLEAADRSLRRLGARQVPTGTYPVIFEARAAGSLFGHFLSAISGGSIYRKSSFLLDQLGQAVFPDWMHIHEQPHLRGALGSAPFDADGVATRAQDFVTGGRLRSWVLSGYSARRLGLHTTGNAGGVHNLCIDSNAGDLPQLLRRMDRGLLVTELMGFGVNAVTGDYSRGASGFWIEDGEIAWPVEEITIAGNLRDMFLRIQAAGDDIETRGNIRCGSILLESMAVAGS